MVRGQGARGYEVEGGPFTVKTRKRVAAARRVAAQAPPAVMGAAGAHVCEVGNA